MRIKRIAAVLTTAVLSASCLLSACSDAPSKDPNVKNDVKQDDAIVEKVPRELSMHYKLWYDKPANIDLYDDWEKLSLPVGNGNIGGNVFGGLSLERITLNEKTMWKGGPCESRPDYKGGNNDEKGKNGETLKKVQQLFAEGKDDEASKLCDQLIGDSNGYGGYEQFGNLYLDFGKISKDDVTNYSRALDIINGIATVDYDLNGTHYSREIFTSYDENVMVVHLTAEGDKALELTVSFEPENGGDAPRSVNTVVSDDTVQLYGELNDNGLKYSGYMKVLTPEKNQLTKADQKLQISGASEATIILSMGTDYALDYPVYRTGESQKELDKRVKGFVDNASKKSYEDLKYEHLVDFTNLMARVDVDFGQKEPSLTTDALLSGYKSNTIEASDKAYLEVLLYQYGRYLLVSSSRENNILPANLQGIWVGTNGSAWNSDYHINVNLQMNYWPAYNTNLAECAIPMISYVDGLREPGRVTAKTYFGVESTEDNPENGFTANTQSAPYGWTAPGWVFDWGWSPAGVPWMLQNVWEYYEYTLDEEFMKETIYPIMKEEAKFYAQILVEDEEGRLISTPAYSPEHGPRTNGNTYEQSLVWQLFTDTITAGEIVGEDEALLNEWRDILARLRTPIEVGDSGQVKEWYQETTINSMPKSEGNGHRHLSHLLGLYPGDLISEETPEWFEAARVSLDARVDASTGWAMAQRINSWARLGDGEHMYYLIQTLMKGGILDNLWDTHPPFQIDGNFGYTAGVTEALMQSNVGYINLLPALPEAWSNGSVSGLVARGNFEIGMKWENSVPNEVTIKSNKGGDCTVQLKIGSEFSITDSKGNKVSYETVKTNRVKFATNEGETYTIKNIVNLGTPKNVKAQRSSETDVELTWDEADGAESYNVYRSADGGEKNLIASASETKYVDTTAETGFDEEDSVYYSYSVSAVNAVGMESELSSEALEVGYRDEIIDSNDSKVSYGGQWSLFNEDDHYMSTNNCSWTAGSTAELTFVGRGIELYSVAKPNYNGVNVYIDGEQIGDYYLVNASSKTPDTLVFSKTDLDYGEHTIKVVVMDEIVTGVKDNSISIDYFKVFARP